MNCDWQIPPENAALIRLEITRNGQSRLNLQFARQPEETYPHRINRPACKHPIGLYIALVKVGLLRNLVSREHNLIYDEINKDRELRQFWRDWAWTVPELREALREEGDIRTEPDAILGHAPGTEVS